MPILRVSTSFAACFLMLLVVPAPAEEKTRGLVDVLVERLRAHPSALEAVLASYNTIESEQKLGVFERHDLHEGLLKELRALKHPVLARASAAVLARTETLGFPSRVIVLKAMVGDNFPAPREERLAHLVKAARSRDERMAVWGVRLLGASRWPESIDALNSILAEEERAGKFDGFLLNLVHGELFGVLGAEAVRGGSGKVRDAWEKSGKKLPATAVHELSSADRGTTAFFGDRIYPRVVFCIDVSTSMLQNAELSGEAEPAGRTAVRGGAKKSWKPTVVKPKVEIVREELLKALKGLQPTFKFNILSYSTAYHAWQGKAPVKLLTATESAVKSAQEWVRGLKNSSGTNIHDTLAAALEIPEVETVYLLSDGAPSVGGGPPEIERRVAALNYLRGARILTYGFTGRTREDFDEEFMKRLAKQNWGWYRRLNR